MQRSFLISTTFFLALSQASLSLASGGGSYGGGGGGSFNNTVNSRPVDQNYEIGKAIFKGRQSGEPSLEYCVLADGEKVPLKRKSLKAYKKASYDTFANSLFQCDQPDKLVADGLSRDSLLYVLYYLNKRHNLKLKGA